MLKLDYFFLSALGKHASGSGGQAVVDLYPCKAPSALLSLRTSREAEVSQHWDPPCQNSTQRKLQIHLHT